MGDTNLTASSPGSAREHSKQMLTEIAARTLMFFPESWEVPKIKSKKSIDNRPGNVWLVSSGINLLPGSKRRLSISGGLSFVWFFNLCSQRFCLA